MIKTKKSLSGIKPYAIDAYYSNLELKLDSNENPYGPSSKVLDAIRNVSSYNVCRYPAYGELIEKLSELTSFKTDNFVVTNGCDEAINAIFSAFLDKNDKVLSFAPTFSMPKLYSKILEAEFVEIPYKDKWKYDLDEFEKHISNEVKILYLTSPNNPTGDIVPIDVVKRLVSNYKDKLVVIDCTYINYADVDKAEYFDLVNDFDNVAILRSFSKDYALAGLRLGYILADAKIINEVKKILSPYSVNTMAVKAGVAALSDIDYFNNIKGKISESKKILKEGLKNYGFKVYESSANFILVDFGLKAEFVYKKFLNNNTQVKYFKNVQGLENCLRITIPKLEDVNKLLDLLKSRPLFVFDLDGVVFDVSNSYRLAIKKTFEYFTEKTCTDSDIQKIKNLGGMSNDWDLTHRLISDAGVNVNYDSVVNVFQDLFFVPDRKDSKGFIDNEENVFNKNFFEKLNKYADCAVFTGRPTDEAFYSLAKFGLMKYFSYFVCNEDVLGNFKPSPFGLEKIKSSCIYSKILYFGDTVDDMKAAVDAKIDGFGIIPPNAPDIDATTQKLFEFGAKGVFDSPEKLYNELVEKDFVCK